MKTDGRFIIKSGGITQGIQKELGLTKEECKKLGSIWTQIINEFDGKNNGQKNMTVTNNRGKSVDSSTNYFVYKNAVIEFSKESWQKIVNLVNKALDKNIEIEYEIANLGSDNSNKKLPEIISSPELDNWFLDDENFVIDMECTENNVFLIHESKSQVIKEWRKNYENEYGKMNFPTAVKYLNDNPDLPDEIQEYIKNAFGICDGDITKNKQGSKGTCHLLSCKAELDACKQLSDIVDNIVVQNNDGTVTVTLFGIKEDDGSPYRVTLTNKEIRDSYKYDHLPKHTKGSSDPDAAVLELAYQKLVAYVTEKNKEYDERYEDLQSRIFVAALNNTLKILNDPKSEDENLNAVKNYLNDNIEYFNNVDCSEIIKKMKSDNMFDIYKQCLDPNCEIVSKLKKKETELKKQKYEFGMRHFMYNKIDYSEETMVETLGARPTDTFQILTGLKADEVRPEYPEGFWDLPNVNELQKQYKIDAYDKFLQNTNIDSTPIVVTFIEKNETLNILDSHAYSLRKIYIDENTGEKMVIVHNPHGYDIVPIPYEQFLENLDTITCIRKRKKPAGSI